MNNNNYINWDNLSYYPGFPILYAIEHYQLDKFKILITKKKVGLNYRTIDGVYFLIHDMCSISYQDDINIFCVKTIVEAGAEIDQPCMNGLLPIHYAATYSTPNVMQYLIDQGADINVMEKNNCMKAIHYACYRGNIRVVKYLVYGFINEFSSPESKKILTTKSKIDLYEKNGDNHTPLDYTSNLYLMCTGMLSNNHKEILDFIKEKMEIDKRTIFTTKISSKIKENDKVKFSIDCFYNNDIDLIIG